MNAKFDKSVLAGSKQAPLESRQALWGLWADEARHETAQEPKPLVASPLGEAHAEFDLLKKARLHFKPASIYRSVAQIRARLSTLNAEISEARERLAQAELSTYARLSATTSKEIAIQLSAQRQSRQRVSEERERIRLLNDERQALQSEREMMETLGRTNRHTGSLFSRRRALAFDLKEQERAAQTASARLRAVNAQAKARIAGMQA